MFVKFYKLLVVAALLLILSIHVVTHHMPDAQAQTSRRKNAVGSKPAPNARAAQLASEGVAAFERGDLSAARELLQQAVKANPKDATAHTILGAIADQINDLPAAELHFSQAAKLTPLSPSARNNHGAILLRLNREREAAAEFEAALRVDPKQSNALINLAQIYFGRGDAVSLRAADDLFSRAYALAPDAEFGARSDHYRSPA